MKDFVAPKKTTAITQNIVFFRVVSCEKYLQQRTKRATSICLTIGSRRLKSQCFLHFFLFMYEEKRFVNGKHVRLNFCCSLELHSVYLFASLSVIFARGSEWWAPFFPAKISIFGYEIRTNCTLSTSLTHDLWVWRRWTFSNFKGIHFSGDVYKRSFCIFNGNIWLNFSIEIYR